MTITLAQAADATAHTALFVELVRNGGPVAVGLVILVIMGLVVWKIAGKYTIDALVTISANFARATSELERITDRAQDAVTRAEAIVNQKEDRR